jgi:tetratricopeptide (TPR) repeat protein
MKRMLLAILGLAVIGVVPVGCTTTWPFLERSMERGVEFYRNAEYVSASGAFSEAIEMNPTSADAWNNRAAARLRLGDINRAIADFNRALELAPHDPEIYYNRGNALVAAGLYREAIVDYTRALEIMPAYSTATFNRGSAYALLGQRDAAQADWARAIVLEPDPWTKGAMQASVARERAPIVALARADVPQPAVASAPYPGMGPATVPVPTTPAPVAGTPPVPPAVPPVVTMVPPTAAPQPAASVQTLDARALAARAMTRELDGDRAGALADLRTALALEPDAGRRAALTRFIRLLETPR